MLICLNFNLESIPNRYIFVKHFIKKNLIVIYVGVSYFKKLYQYNNCDSNCQNQNNFSPST